ncbi:MAG TPA: hypothetical protein VEY67_02495, partial [Candidatus Dormibacteraeota bacterium]|nr:hypothetical protein [Candidatus Dormibacteraeota bacterium]
FDGYYEAGLVSNQTINAGLPFGGNAALLAAYSPLKLVSTVDKSMRSRLFFVIAGDPAEPLYGPQMTQLLARLDALGYPHATIADPIGHSWIEVRRLLPAALEAVAARLVAQGVFQ